MFDEAVFYNQFKAIASHFKHEMSGPILKIYYEHLSENLTEEEFIESLKQSAVKLPVYRGLPSADQFVELIKGSRESKALQEWQMIVKASAANDIDQLAYLSTRGHVALSAIGGLGAVSYHEGSLQWLQKDFVTVYCQCSDKDVNILKPTKVEKTLPDYMREVEDPITPEQRKILRESMQKFINKNNPSAGN